MEGRNATNEAEATAPTLTGDDMTIFTVTFDILNNGAAIVVHIEVEADSEYDAAEFATEQARLDYPDARCISWESIAW